MHELSIAEAVVRVASAHAAGRPVARVFVRVGHLRQVVPSALELAFELVADGTELEGASVEIEHVPAAVCCSACGATTAVEDFPLRCAACGGLAVEVVAGEELLVEALELEEELTTNGGVAYDG